jgi:hypothetical protein
MSVELDHSLRRGTRRTPAKGNRAPRPTDGNTVMSDRQLRILGLVARHAQHELDDHTPWRHRQRPAPERWRASPPTLAHGLPPPGHAAPRSHTATTAR